MALSKQAEPGTRVTVAVSSVAAAPTRAYMLNGRHGAVDAYDPVYRRYTVRLDSG